MQNRIKQAREDRGLSAYELAAMIGVDASTVYNWEAGRRQVTVENLLRLSEVLEFGFDYLLGRDQVPIPLTEPVAKEALRALHGQPVWTAARGWMLVNIVKSAFVLHDQSLLAFDEVRDDIYLVPPALSFTLRGAGKPLGLDAVLGHDRLWIEPISCDPDLAAELRGWYYMHERRLAQNEHGSRFYIDTYGAKWLAFADCFGGLG